MDTTRDDAKRRAREIPPYCMVAWSGLGGCLQLVVSCVRCLFANVLYRRFAVCCMLPYVMRALKLVQNSAFGRGCINREIQVREREG